MKKLFCGGKKEIQNEKCYKIPTKCIDVSMD